MKNISTVIERLKAGNARFAEGDLQHPHQDLSRLGQVLPGQDPFAIVLTCADSRVVPELIFDTGIGDLFVIRVAGNIANESTIATIEYAVAHLAPKAIIVMGHTRCGAVNVTLEMISKDQDLGHLLSFIAPAVTSENKGNADAVARRNALLTSERLQEHSDIIRNAVKSGKIGIFPAFYHLHSGEVTFL